MSKKLKNVIMIFLIIALCVAMYFTVGYRRDRLGYRNNIADMNMKFGEFENNREMQKPPAIPSRENREIAEKTKSNVNEIPKENREIIKQGSQNPGDVPEKLNRNFGRNTIKTNVLCTLEILSISILSIYLIMSKFNKLTLKETLSNKKQIIIFFISVIFITIIATIFIINFNRWNPNVGNKIAMPEEENTIKDTKAEDVDAGKNVTGELINLEEHNSNITITNAGTYTLTGEFANTVLINADGEVVLNFENVIIKNNTTAAVANISTNSLIINLLENTNNILSDGGSSEYDSCVYSIGSLTIKGEGNLEILGGQDEGEGIATETNNITIDGGNIKIESNDDGLNAGGDGGTITINNGSVYIKASGDGIDSNKNVVINGGNVYTIGSAKGGDAGMDADEGITINGGNVIALGSDMLENPLSDSKQKFLSFNLNSIIKNGTTITLKNKDGENIEEFEANEDFKTLIISNEKIVNGTYYLYAGEEKIAETNV